MIVVAPDDTGLVGRRPVVYPWASVKVVTMFAFYVEIVSDEKIEHRINLKFLAKHGKSATESFRLLTDVWWKWRHVMTTCFWVARTTSWGSWESWWLEATLIEFFDTEDVIMIEWIPRGQTVNQRYYLQVLTTLGRTIKKKAAW